MEYHSSTLFPQTIRDYKEGLLCAAQEPSLITHSLMSNLRTKFVGYLSEGENIEAMSSSLNLDDDEKEGLAKIGERGYWLVKKIIGPSLSHYVEAACGS